MAVSLQHTRKALFNKQALKANTYPDIKREGFSGQDCKMESPAGEISLPELPFPGKEDETPSEAEVSGEQTRWNELLKKSKSPAQCPVYIQESRRSLGWKRLSC